MIKWAFRENSIINRSITKDKSGLGWFSPLTRRILAINIIAIVILGGGLLFQE